MKNLTDLGNTRFSILRSLTSINPFILYWSVLPSVVAVKLPIVTLSKLDGEYPVGDQFPMSEKSNPELSQTSPPAHVRSVAFSTYAVEKNNEANNNFFMFIKRLRLLIFLLKGLR